ncbi:MAG: hypothetical protein U0228_26955 [Myxococcaceae bacterium]
MTAVLLLALTTVLEPHWCALGDKPTPLDPARVRQFVADLRSPDLTVKRCALDNLESVQLTDFPVAGTPEARTALRESVQVGLFTVLAEGKLDADEFARVRELTLTRGKLTNLRAKEEMNAAFMRGTDVARAAICGFLALGVREPDDELLKLVRVRAATPSCLAALVVLDPRDARTRAAVAQARDSGDPLRRAQALSATGSLPPGPDLDGPALRFLRQDCEAAALNAVRADSAWLEVLLDVARARKCPEPVRVETARTLISTFHQAPAAVDFVGEVVSTPRWPEYRDLVLGWLCREPAKSPKALQALLASPVSEREAALIREHAYRWPPELRALLKQAATPALRAPLKPPATLQVIKPMRR